MICPNNLSIQMASISFIETLWYFYSWTPLKPFFQFSNKFKKQFLVLQLSLGPSLISLLSLGFAISITSADVYYHD